MLAFLIKNHCNIKQRINSFLRSLWLIQVSTSIPGTRFFLVTKIVSVILAQRLKNQSTYAVSHLFCGPFLSSFLCFHSYDFFSPSCFIEKQQVQVFLAGLPELISYRANLFELRTRNKQTNKKTIKRENSFLLYIF